jgi:nitrite reductase (NADH) small subunit
MTAMLDSAAWLEVGTIDDIPPLGARVVVRNGGNIAIFRTGDGRIFAIDDRCPHKGGPLSQGIVHGTAVTCPLHNWTIDLASGEAAAPDIGCARTIAVRLEGRRILLSTGA